MVGRQSGAYILFLEKPATVLLAKQPEHVREIRDKKNYFGSRLFLKSYF
jgi:hypothetical protein